MDDIKIRYLRPDRAQACDALVDLHQQCFRACEFDPLLMARAHWWLASDARGRALGFAGLTAQPSGRGSGYLCRAGVVPRARGQGVHRRLIRVRLAFARKTGLHDVVSDTWRNPGSAANLVACGFESFRPHRPWGLSGALYWRNALGLR